MTSQFPQESAKLLNGMCLFIVLFFFGQIGSAEKEVGVKWDSVGTTLAHDLAKTTIAMSDKQVIRSEQGIAAWTLDPKKFIDQSEKPFLSVETLLQM